MSMRNAVFGVAAVLCSAVGLHAQIPGSPYLKDLAAAHNVELGVAVQGGHLTNDSAYATFARQNFAVLKPEYEMKANTIRTDTGGWNYGPMDTLANFARTHGRKLHGHALVWYKHPPRWVATQNATTVEAAMNAHIDGVVDRYRRYNGATADVVTVWDVVNEALRDSPNTAWSGTWWEKWLRRVGDGNAWSHVPDYIGKAFHRARARHAAGVLIYNDYGIELDDPANTNEKSDAAYALMQDLKARGVPIDGIGFQCHFTTTNPPDLVRLANNLKRFADLGLKVYITELDVRVATGQDTTLERSKQADVYWGVVRTALLQPACPAIQVWGFTDKYVPQDGSMYTDRYPMMLDASLNAKSAYWAVRDLLRDGPFTGTHQIVNANSGMAIHVQAGSTSPGAALLQYTKEPTWGSQRWTFELIGNRAYRVRNTQSGLQMHVVNGSTASGALLDQDPVYGQWRIEYAGSNTYRLVAVHSNHVARVQGASTTLMAPLEQSATRDAAARWQVTPVP